MSVIFGIRAREGRPIAHQDLNRLACATERYAPDGTSFHVGDEIGMGFQAYHTHQRSYLESKPLIDEHGNMLAFDGRLDNYRDLCGLLGIRTYESSDSLIVLKAFDRWGDNCFSQFVGDWALALWANALQSLYLARDHAGTRTLYFEQAAEHILWSTYLETFFVTEKTRALDEDFAASYLACLPIGEKTPYKGIRAVPPAHFLKFEQHRTKTVAHWTPRFRNRILYSTDAEYERHFFMLLGQAVARRSHSSDPVIAQLSGGMDSTAIVSISDYLRKEAGASPAELIETVSYYDDSEPNWNEKPYFTAVERRRGKTGVHIQTSYLERTLELPDPAYLLPGADGSTLAAERRLEESIGTSRYRAILSGIGGDELLGGPINPLPELSDYLMRGNLRRLLSRSIEWCVAEKISLIRLLPEVMAFIAILYWGPSRNEMRLPAWLTTHTGDLLQGIRRLEGGSLRFLPSCIDAGRLWLTILETEPHRFLSADIRYEYRYPFLDRDLVEFLLRVPPEQIRRPGNRRSLMRRALQHIIAPEVLERKRKAFPTRGPLQFLERSRTEIGAIFSQSRLSTMGYVDEGRLQALLDQADKLVEWARPLQRAIDLELWLRRSPQFSRTETPDHTGSVSVEVACRSRVERQFNEA